MSSQSGLVHRLAAMASLLVLSLALAGWSQTKIAPQTKADTLSFAGMEYHHRWSKNGQNEFTPQNDTDLTRWHDMVTINIHQGVGTGDQLAEMANRILGNYKSHGKIVRTDSKPRTPQHPAEHLIVALLGDPSFVEAAFARVLLIDRVGVVVVYSHRVYGKGAAETMGEWLKTNGTSLEKALMSWDRIPSLAALRQLPQSK